MVRGRKSKEKKLKKKIYIFTEGYTEKNYFKILSRKYNLSSSVNIEIKPEVVGKSGISLLKHAVSKLQKLSKAEKAILGSAYIIFDKDDLSDVDVEEVIVESKKEGINISFSNECFEVWLVAHFEKPNPSFTKKKLYKKMETHLSCTQYERFHKDNEELLKVHLEDRVSSAVENCKEFGKFNQTQIKVTPYTNIGQIVKEIFDQKIY